MTKPKRKPKRPILKIPCGLKNLKLVHNLDDLRIKVTDDCTWCFTDHGVCFPGGFLDCGKKTATTPPTTYGPYYPKGVGTVTFDAVPTGECDPDRKHRPGQPVPAGPHSIIVS